MADIENVRSELEQQIRWIEEIECHKFPGWLNTTNAMRDALELLKEKEAHWIKKSCDALYCSNCDAPSINKQPYCYQCGSRMT